MSIHIIKLAVGAESLDDLADYQRRTLMPYEGGMAVPVWTRYKPTRSDELLNGGSIYRVIKRRIVCRQQIVGFEEAQHPAKGKMCLIMCSPEIITTVAAPKRPFQGWRYLKQKDAPADSGIYDPENEAPPAELADDLREAGLL